VDTEVTDNAARKRFEITVDGEPAGFAAYQLGDGVVVFTHTQVDPAFEGQGVGTMLARSALDQVRGRGDKVVARCPFIAGWIEKHPDYQDLLVAA
jgi:predicted GNAT family acetyltransferase